MKIHLKDNKIALYDIESDYRQYLFQYDFRVNLKSGRRFVGIIVGIEDYTYFISLTSIFILLTVCVIKESIVISL